MRVISGKARGIPLKTAPGNNTRPTTDRIKETLFNIIQYDVPGSTFLDLFAGSGSIGVEALSRGAGSVYFVENDPSAVKFIRHNIKSAKVEEGSKVFFGDARDSIQYFVAQNIVFDIIFMDPPYGHSLEKKILYAIYDSCLLSENTNIIIETDLKTDFSYLDELGLALLREKNYKTNRHVFIKRKNT